jgi:hypothetical protein
MCVYEAIAKELESVGTDTASGGADVKIASPPLGLKHSRKIHIDVPEDLTLEGQSIESCRDIRIDVPDPAEIARVVGATADALRLIGCDPIRGNDRRPVVPLSRTNRDPTTFVQRVYPLANILMTLFAWGVSHE